MRWLTLGLAACQPWRAREGTCTIDPPAAGDVVVEPLSCDEQLVPGGEGLVGVDWFVATDRYRLVVRHPESSLTQAGVGGLTLLDAATWDGGDVLHELVPLVGGGWLDVERWEALPDGFRVEGRVVSLPDAPADDEGAPATVRWRFGADRIAADGADGWFVHPLGVATVGSRSLATTASLMWMPPVEHDLGGALRLTGGELVFDAPLPALAAVGEQRLSGTTTGTHLELLDDDGEVAVTVPVGGTFDLQVPAVAAVRAIGPGAPSPAVAPAEALELLVGPPGWVRIRPLQARSVHVRWVSADGRSGNAVVAPDGTRLGVGAGAVTLSAWSAFPHRTSEIAVEVPEGATVDLPLDLGARPPGRIALGLGLPSDRSRDWRGTDLTAARAAWATGYDMAAFLVDDDATSLDGVPVLAHGGTRLDGPGWKVEAWPTPVSPRKNAHGAPQVATDDPAHALQLLWGGADAVRHLRVDLPTLRALGPPQAMPLAPTLLELSPPDEELSSWQPWFDALTARVPLVPTGPVTWVGVADPTQVAKAEVDQALSRGHVAAGNGPWATLSIGNARQGDVVARGEPMVVAAYAAGRVDRLDVVTDLERITLFAPGEVELHPDTRWAVAVATGPEDWAVTGPLWFVDPGDLPSTTARRRDR